jgi:hypothetical protein
MAATGAPVDELQRVWFSTRPIARFSGYFAARGASAGTGAIQVANAPLQTARLS